MTFSLVLVMVFGVGFFVGMLTMALLTLGPIEEEVCPRAGSIVPFPRRDQL